MKYFRSTLVVLVFLLLSIAFVQEVTADIDAVDVETSYIEYTGYVNERDHDFVARANPNALTLYPEIKFTAENLILGELIDDTQSATLSGQLTIKDIEKEVSVPITIENQDTNLIVSGEFTVLLSDFDIKRPSALGDVVDDDILIKFQIKLN